MTVRCTRRVASMTTSWLVSNFGLLDCEGGEEWQLTGPERQAKWIARGTPNQGSAPHRVPRSPHPRLPCAVEGAISSPLLVARYATAGTVIGDARDHQVQAMDESKLTAESWSAGLVLQRE